MASIYRSDKMALCQIFISSEASYNCVSELGELGLVQFRDLNPDINAFQRKYVHEVRRCDEMERKLRYLQTESEKDDIKVIDNGENPEAPQPREMGDLEATFEKLENELREVNSNAETLQKNFMELTELKYVLESSQTFFAAREVDDSMSSSLIPVEEGKSGAAQLGFVTGTINRDRMAGFERMLWRVSRGNAFVRQQDIETPLEDPVSRDKLNKVVFIIFFQGDQLRNKVKKICDGCKASLYPCPETSSDVAETVTGVKTRLEDLSTILSQTTDHRHRVLSAAAKHLRVWFIKVRKIKGIYHTLNMFNVDVTNKCLIAEGWIPIKDQQRITESLGKGTERSGSTVEPILNCIDTNQMPPTFHRTNKFTNGFQALIDAYGVGTYREINPGLYTTTTFPFLFAVMFGDLGHGMIMFSFALWMVLKEKSLAAAKSTNEIWNMFFGGRYIIFMMGLFSMYTGIIYNDIFSKSFNIGFGSHFHVGDLAQEAAIEDKEPEYMIDPGNTQDYDGYPYPFGLDPMWQLGVNKINFLNSYKMKISIIIGVIHMMFGVSLSLFNNLYFKRWVNIIFEFIPQVIFLLFIFGYLCIMVIIKWVNFGAGEDFGFDFDHDTRCAPSVLILFIDMVLFKHEPPPNTCSSAYLFEAQEMLQKILVVIAVLMVPIMLFPKPFILRYLHDKKERIIGALAEGEDNLALDIEAASTSSAETEKKEKNGDVAKKSNNPAPAHAEGEEEFDFQEIFIHQCIHTIEYVLGSVSHTASYLRLWALSLAHAQLSEVLWMMVFAIGLRQSSTVGCIILYLIFAAWSFLTLSILVLMEGLSAFLHTLRLHWVEFCSKFYEGQGYAFTPFAFKQFVEVEEE